MAKVYSKTDAAQRIAEYILETELENYLSFCEDNFLDPKVICGDRQADHVYSLAMVALGIETPDFE